VSAPDEAPAGLPEETALDLLCDDYVALGYERNSAAAAATAAADACAPHAGKQTRHVPMNSPSMPQRLLVPGVPGSANSLYCEHL